MILDNELIEKANCYIDENHERFSTLGKRFFGRFGRTQVRNLQQITCSATRFADIEDFVKNQMGKGKSGEWKEVGEEVLQQLQRLRTDSKRKDFASGPAEQMALRQMALRLYLARGWVRAVVSEYLYRVALDQMGRRR